MIEQKGMTFDLDLLFFFLFLFPPKKEGRREGE
jgi:hypothetical protein